MNGQLYTKKLRHLNTQELKLQVQHASTRCFWQGMFIQLLPEIKIPPMENHHETTQHLTRIIQPILVVSQNPGPKVFL